MQGRDAKLLHQRADQLNPQGGWKPLKQLFLLVLASKQTNKWSGQHDPLNECYAVYSIFTLFLNLTSPCRRLANPRAALLKPGAIPKPADNRLFISASPGPPCPLACRWRTLMASSRRSSSLLCWGSGRRITHVRLSVIYVIALFLR